MGRNFISACIDGTSALEIPQREPRAARTPRHAGTPRRSHEYMPALPEALRSSEMFCSLLTEDFRGCAYGIFTRRGVRVLASCSAALGALSVLIGS